MNVNLQEKRLLLAAVVTHGLVSQSTWGAPAYGPALGQDCYDRTAEIALAQADAIIAKASETAGSGRTDAARAFLEERGQLNHGQQ